MNRREFFSHSTADEMVYSFLKSLRAPGELAPSCGFYDRVLVQVEQMRQSIWLPIIYSRLDFSKFAAILILSLTALAYVFGTESTVDSVSQPSYEMILNGTNVRQKRDAVLAQFASYESP